MTPATPRPRLLYLIHAYENLAGVELHARSLVEGLRDRYEMAVAYPHQGMLRLWREDGSCTDAAVNKVAWPQTLYREPQFEQALARIFDLVRPDLIHIQHFLHWPLSVIDQAVDFGVPVVLSLHDFYSITPFFTMPGIDDPRESFTPAYSQSVFGADITPYLRERREILTRSFERVHARITISPFLQRNLGAIFPCAFRVLEYGIRPFTAPPTMPAAGGLRFGYVGSLIPQKGWQSVHDAFPAVRARHPDAELHFYGGPVPNLPPSPGVIFHGAYRPADLPRISSEFDVAVIPSVVAETYCMVLSEMWQAGKPVAVSRIGALGDRVTDGVNGKLFQAGNPASIAETLSWFAGQDDWRSWTLPQPRLLDAMLAEFDQLYRGLLAGHGSSQNTTRIAEGQMLTQTRSPAATPAVDVQSRAVTINGKTFTLSYPASPMMETEVLEIFGQQAYPFLPFLQGDEGVILDIGANVGCTAVWFTGLYPQATIHAFEPARDTFAYLRENTRSLDNVRPWQCGLYDRDCSLPLYLGSHASVTNSLGQSPSNTAASEVVGLRRVSTFLTEQGIGRIRLMKIDTEGAEVPILRDCEPWLDRVSAIHVEYHSERDRLEIDHLLCPRFLLYAGKIHRVHQGVLTYVARVVLDARTDANRFQISRVRA